MQKVGVDYNKTFSPVVMLKSIHILISIAMALDYEIWQGCQDVILEWPS